MRSNGRAITYVLMPIANTGTRLDPNCTMVPGEGYS